MPTYWLRSTAFNITFYLYHLAICLLALPTLILPRRFYLATVRTYVRGIHFLERLILGLDYEVRGLKNLPKSGSCIIAAKHESTYETLKLHMLFKDPAIILKKELLRIPIYGWFLKKSHVIAIDRSSRERAMKSMAEGSQKVKAEGRPIIIFPQGTRVPAGVTTKEKPYKQGIYRIQEKTRLPVIPLALNSGYYYPNKGWLKRPGTVIFEFLPPIEPGLKRETLMARLEKRLEKKSADLLKEAKTKPGTKRKAQKTRSKKANGQRKKSYRFLAGAGILCIFALLFVAYSIYWSKVAKSIREAHGDFLKFEPRIQREFDPVKITGFPGPITVTSPEEYIHGPLGTLRVKNLVVSGWPLPGLAHHISAGPVEINSLQMPEPLRADSFQATFYLDRQNIEVENSLLKLQNFVVRTQGQINHTVRPYPEINLMLEMKNHEFLIGRLFNQGLINDQAALFLNAGFNALKTGDTVRVPLRLKDRDLYAGPLLIATLPDIPPPQSSLYAPVQDLESPQGQAQ